MDFPKVTLIESVMSEVSELGKSHVDVKPGSNHHCEVCDFLVKLSSLTTERKLSCFDEFVGRAMTQWRSAAVILLAGDTPEILLTVHSAFYIGVKVGRLQAMEE